MRGLSDSEEKELKKMLLPDIYVRVGAENKHIVDMKSEEIIDWLKLQDKAMAVNTVIALIVGEDAMYMGEEND